jgi:ATP-dependent DNA ligase
MMACLRFNEHLDEHGPDVFQLVCKLGLDDILSKRKDYSLRPGRSPDWIKSKNPDAPVKSAPMRGCGSSS